MSEPKKQWEVWSEGYRATGEHQTAIFWGIFEADSFQGACDIAFADRDAYYNSYGGIIWGCRLFDNESDARATYG